MLARSIYCPRQPQLVFASALLTVGTGVYGPAAFSHRAAQACHASPGPQSQYILHSSSSRTADCTWQSNVSGKHPRSPLVKIERLQHRLQRG
jgi:hypothetical protein